MVIPKRITSGQLPPGRFHSTGHGAGRHTDCSACFDEEQGMWCPPAPAAPLRRRAGLSERIMAPAGCGFRQGFKPEFLEYIFLIAIRWQHVPRYEQP